MFRLDEKTHRWFPVDVELFDDDGRKRTFSFDAEFEQMEQSDINKLLKDGGLPDVELADRFMTAFRKVEGPKGEVLEANADNKRRLIERPGVARAIARAWMKQNGIEGKS